MNENRSILFPFSALLGTGSLVAVLSVLGFAPVGDQAVGTPLENTPTEPTKTGPKLPETVIRYPASNGMLSVSALMWDDPFQYESTVRDSKSLSNQLHVTDAKSGIKATIKSKLKNTGKIMYLVVPVAEGNTKEDIEARRRTRHAVELALANQGFSLPFSDRMSFRKVNLTYHFKPRDRKGSEIKACVPLIVPTKLYKHKDGSHFVLVTWVQESNLGKRPLDTIDQLLRGVVVSLANTSTDADKGSGRDTERGTDRARLRVCKQWRSRESLCILGPQSSDSIREIVCDAKNISCNDDGDFYEGWNGRIMLCNYAGTATDDSLGIKPGQKKISIGKEAMKLIHTIGSDERLVRIMKRELVLRGVWPSANSPVGMVMFAEQNSLSYLEDLQDQFSSSSGAEPVFVPYLKGIATVDSDHPSVDDYLDRSMTRLARYSGTTFGVSHPIRLIGILGSDWDDKNLILQRARAVFPVATCFTFELDHRFFDSGERGRNLIVASHYGLRLEGRSDLFGQVSSIPRFRDQYQTSAFAGLSVLCKAFMEDQLASEDFLIPYGASSQNLFDLVGRRETDAKADNLESYLKPRVFEIGRNQPIQLRTDSSADIQSLPLRQPPPTPSIHEQGWTWLILVVSLLACVVLLNTVAIFSSDADDFRSRLWDGAKRTIRTVASPFTAERVEPTSQSWSQIIALIIGAVICAVLIFSAFAENSEPILVGEGVSIWPSIIGLYMVIAFSLGSLRDLMGRRADHTDSAAAEALDPDQRHRNSGALQIAGTIVIAFYLSSYFESGFIAPPARDWVVRWLAVGILFVATFCILLVASRCLIYALHARKLIANYRKSVPTDEPKQLAKNCLSTMSLSIETSRQLVVPACLSMLFLAARSKYWDAWGLDRSWYVLIAVPILTCLVAAIIVRTTAIKYRNVAIDSIREDRFNILVGGRRRRSANRQMLEHALDEIVNLHRGPFGPVSRDYLLGAATIVAAVACSGPLTTFLNRWGT